MIRNTTQKIAIIASVFFVGTMATISLMDTNAYAGFFGPHPDPVITQLHGPRITFFSFNEPFISVDVFPYPNDSTKIWLGYSVSGTGFSGFGDGCIMDKKSVRNNEVHFNTTELDCRSGPSGDNFTLNVQLNANGFESRANSGNNEFCLTVRNGTSGPLVLWCDEVSGRTVSQSSNGTGTIIVDGQELSFDVDPLIDQFSVLNLAHFGKCNVRMEGDPVINSCQLSSACPIGSNLFTRICRI